MTRRYTKRAAHFKKEDQLELVARIRAYDGAVLAEYTFRPKRDGIVQIVNYFPSGDIESHGGITLEQFMEELDRIKRSRESEEPEAAVPTGA